MDWQSARWIWLEDDGQSPNSRVVFQRDFRLDELPDAAVITLSADSVYRLRINGQWCADGPGAAYPENYSCDALECSHLLRCGLNRLEAEVCFLPGGVRGGLIACLEMQLPGGEKEYLCSDNSWRAAAVRKHFSRTVPVKETMPFPEFYDNAGEEPPVFVPATVVCDPEAGPWKNLSLRPTPFLTRCEALIHRVTQISAVEPDEGAVLMLPAAEKKNVLCAAEVIFPEEGIYPLFCHGGSAFVNGKTVEEDLIKVSAGRHFICWSGSNDSETALGIQLPPGAEIADHKIFKTVLPDSWSCPRTWADFTAAYPDAEVLTEADFFSDAGALKFLHRKGREPADGYVENLQALIYSDDRCTVLHPVEGQDIELRCELAHENTGFWNFVLKAPAGTLLDLAVVNKKGELTGNIRYVCSGVWDRYTAHTRCCGSTLFVTLRRMTGDVRIQSLRLVESTYPVVPCGEFHSSDRELDRIYAASLQKLKLSMLDVLVNDPYCRVDRTLLNKQMKSVMAGYGAWDLLRHTLTLESRFWGKEETAPDEWNGRQLTDGLTWVLACRDFFRETGDQTFAAFLFPAIRRFLENIRLRLDPVTGLVRNSGTGGESDFGHPFELLHTLFFKGALDASGELAEVLSIDWTAFADLSAELTAAVNRQWDERNLAYFGALEEDGTPVPEFSVHTSMLSLLFDIIPENFRASACANTVSPRSGLLPVTSPGACRFWYETLDKLGMPEEILTHSGLEDSGTALWFLARLVLGLKTSDGGRTFTVSPRITGLEYASGTRSSCGGPVSVSWFRSGEREVTINASAPPGIELVYEENLSLRDHNVKFNIIQSEKR